MRLPSSYTNMQPNGLFFNAFLEALLWATPSDVEDSECDSMNELYGFEDINQQSADMLKTLCDEFIEKAGNNAILERDYGQAGHDFFLTIAGHGCGFWDGDWAINGDRLTAICEDWINSIDVYSDGKEVFIDVSTITQESH